MFAYCGNNPVSREDHNGQAWETGFDLITWGVSLRDVTEDPNDPMAWLGLLADTADLIPFVTGLGETVRAVNVARKTADTLDDLYDGSKASRLDELLEDAVNTTSRKGKTTNYQKSGGYEQASADFYSLEPSDINSISTKYGDGLTGTLANQATVILRRGSSTGGPTLEIQISSRRAIKIRY